MKARPFGTLPLTAWAFMEHQRVQAGHERLALFWTKRGATTYGQAFKALTSYRPHPPRCRIVRVVVQEAGGR